MDRALLADRGGQDTLCLYRSAGTMAGVEFSAGLGVFGAEGGVSGRNRFNRQSSGAVTMTADKIAAILRLNTAKDGSLNIDIVALEIQDAFDLENAQRVEDAIRFLRYNLRDKL